VDPVARVAAARGIRQRARAVADREVPGARRADDGDTIPNESFESEDEAEEEGSEGEA